MIFGVLDGAQGSSFGNLTACMLLLLHFASLVFAALALCGLGYMVLSTVGAVRFLRQKSGDEKNFTPAISILKPLKGFDPEMYESFRSHCLQDYSGGFEIIFGVNE